MPETNKHRALNAAQRPITLITNYGMLLRSRAYWGFVSVGSLVFGGMFAFMVGVPFVVIESLGVLAVILRLALGFGDHPVTWPGRGSPVELPIGSGSIAWCL